MDPHPTVYVINTSANNVTPIVPVRDYPTGVAVSPDGTKVYVTNDCDNALTIIDTATDTETATYVDDAMVHPYGIAVTPDGTKAYAVSYTHLDVYKRQIYYMRSISYINYKITTFY